MEEPCAAGNRRVVDAPVAVSSTVADQANTSDDSDAAESVADASSTQLPVATDTRVPLLMRAASPWPATVVARAVAFHGSVTASCTTQRPREQLRSSAVAPEGDTTRLTAPPASSA
jgi:hypothetical protein